jgi:hypothetical protein
MSTDISAGNADTPVEDRNRAVVRRVHGLAAQDDREAPAEVRDANYRPTLPDGRPAPVNGPGSASRAAASR